jgi:hypothetical protein
MSDLILTLDPSSTCLGWAKMRLGEMYLGSGRIVPHVQKPRKGYEAYARIDSICAQLFHLLNHVQPSIIVMEVTSGNRAGRLGQNVSHLGIYGVAVGAVWREVKEWSEYFTHRHRIPCTVDLVLENEWTRRQPKADRILTATAMFPQYRAADDEGGDEADALMLNVWWQREMLVEGL